MSPSTRRTDTTLASPAPTVFRGVPDQLTCTVPLELGKDWTRAGARPTAALEGAEVQRVTVFGSSAVGRWERRVNLRVRSTTPPGLYPGSLQIGGRTIPIEAEVQASPRVRCEPRRLALDVKPRGIVTTEITVLNSGNVPCVVPISSTFCLFDGDGIHHAIWVALTGEPTPEKQRIDLLLDDLAESHGGLVRVRTAKREDTILPGEARTVQLRLRFSERLRHPHRYAGVWEVDGLHLPVLVTACAPQPSSDEEGSQQEEEHEHGEQNEHGEENEHE